MLAQPQTFPCPNCNEMINDSVQICRHCSTPVDFEAAKIAAELQSKVNQACNDASYLRTAAVTIFVLLGVSLVPFIAFVGYLGSLFTFFIVVVLFIRWQVKFGKLQTSDVDYARAKRQKNIALILWIIAIPIFLVR